VFVVVKLMEIAVCKVCHLLHAIRLQYNYAICVYLRYCSLQHYNNSDPPYVIISFLMSDAVFDIHFFQKMPPVLSFSDFLSFL